MWTKAKPVTPAQARKILARTPPNPNQLKNVLYRAPEPWKARAWKMLMNMNVPPDSLRGVLYSAPTTYRLRVAELMVAAGIKDLGTVMHHAPTMGKRIAAAVILARDPTPAELRLLMRRAPEPYRGIARVCFAELPPAIRKLFE